MAACGSCGRDVPGSARFCPDCGTPVGVAPACASCGEELAPGARFCMSCGTSTPAALDSVRRPSPVPAAARRVTSVLFGDLVGFTTLSESRDQEEVRELLSRYFDECRQVIARYGGTIEKFIGDAVMAVWGVPVAHEDDAERAVRAGLELVAMVTALGEELGLSGLALRVGIVTGEVAVTIGATQEGMVAGDAVNTAARVQTAAAPGQVWVDETTRLLTSAAISYADAGSHQLKGKADPVPLWTVRAVVAAVRGAQRADGLEAPLVGRDRELRLVKELYHRTEESAQPTLLVVAGEAGVGKSRLAWEFEKYADGLSSGISWHSGRCVAYGEGVAFFALAEAVRGRLRAGVGPDDDDEDDHTALERTLGTYVEDAGERAWLQPRLGVLLGIGPATTFPREDLFSAWVTFLERVGSGDPVVLVVDDAQHADDGFVLFLEHLLSVATFGCFVVLLARPELLEGHPSLATNPRATLVHLPQLTNRDIAVLLDGLVAGLPEHTRDQLVQRSAGLPLFAVETVRSLIDRDLVIPRGGQYVLADGESLDLAAIGAPASLQALIAARLDTLAVDERRLVDRASVLGTSFTAESVTGLCDDLPDPVATLERLVRLQILNRESNRLSSEFGHYGFVQSVVRQVAYATLSRRDRKALHLRVVGLFESGGDDADDTAAIRAQHYLDALAAVPDAEDVGQLQKAALANLRRAAARTRSLGSPAEAARHLHVALGLSHDPAERVSVALELAQAELDAGMHDLAIEHAEAVEQLAAESGQRAAAGSSAAIRAQALSLGRGDNEAAVAVAMPWWETLEGDPDSLAAQLALGMAIFQAQARMGARNPELLEKWIQIASRTGDAGALAEGYNSLSTDYANLGLRELSTVLLEAAADLARREHQPGALVRALINLTASRVHDDLDHARDLGQEAVRHAQAVGMVHLSTFARLNLVLVLLWRGDWEEIDALVGDFEPTSAATLGQALPGALMMLAVARGQRIGSPAELGQVDDSQVIAWVDFCRALAMAGAGEVHEAARLGTQSTDRAFAETGFTDDVPHFWPSVAELAAEAGDLDAVAHLVSMVDGEGTGQVPIAMRAHRQHVVGRSALRAGDLVTAEAGLRTAVSLFETWGAAPYRARAQGDLAAVLHELGRADEAAALRAEARAVLEPLGALAWLAELDPAPADAAR